MQAIHDPMASSFRELASNMEITQLQKSTVSTRQQNVRDAIERKMSVLDSFLTGSYSRHTMVAPLSECDIDIFVVLDPTYHSRNGQANLLDRVRTVLLETYSKTPRISRSGQAVTITFTEFKVDVVPAFNRQGGGFLIPDSINNRWINTDPKEHVDIVTSANQNQEGLLVPIIKMIKGWNKKFDDAFESFYLEILAVSIFQSVKISNYSSGVRYFFDKGRESIKYVISDPVGYGGDIQGLRNIKTVHEAVQLFEQSYGRAVAAESYTSRGYKDAAKSEWTNIFGNYFPQS